jgi:hypothetical protein
VVAVVFAVIHWVDRRPGPTTVRVCWAIAVVAIAIATWPLVDGVIERRESSSATERSVRGFFEQIDALEATTDPVLVRGLGVTTNGIAQGVVDELDRAGAPVRVDPRYGFQYGDHRTARPSDVGEVWYVTQDGRYRSLLGDHEGARLVAYSSALSRADDAELVALQQSVAARLRAAGRPDLVDLLDSTVVGAALDAERVAVPGDEVARIEELNQKLARLGGCRCTLIAYPAAVAPDLPFTMGY